MKNREKVLYNYRQLWYNESNNKQKGTKIMEYLTNFELGCLAVAFIMIAPELCDFIRKITKE